MSEETILNTYTLQTGCVLEQKFSHTGMEVRLNGHLLPPDFKLPEITTIGQVVNDLKVAFPDAFKKD